MTNTSLNHSNDLFDNPVGLDGFEFIQRKKDHGFVEVNFKALFESMERDQIKSGMINPQ